MRNIRKTVSKTWKPLVLQACTSVVVVEAEDAVVEGVVVVVVEARTVIPKLLTSPCLETDESTRSK